jgi:beta-lactam-binding protein with PASTA domain
LCGVKGTDNSLWVTIGDPNVGPQVTTVPDVHNEEEKEAVLALHTVGLVVGQELTKPDCDHLKTVADESPDAGTVVPLGSAVDLTFGIHPSHPCQ